MGCFHQHPVLQHKTPPTGSTPVVVSFEYESTECPHPHAGRLGLPPDSGPACVKGLSSRSTPESALPTLPAPAVRSTQPRTGIVRAHNPISLGDGHAPVNWIAGGRGSVGRDWQVPVDLAPERGQCWLAVDHSQINCPTYEPNRDRNRGKPGGVGRILPHIRAKIPRNGPGYTAYNGSLPHIRARRLVRPVRLCQRAPPRVDTATSLRRSGVLPRE